MDGYRYFLAVFTLCLLTNHTLGKDEKVRIFVTDSDSWTSGGAVAGANGFLIGRSACLGEDNKYTNWLHFFFVRVESMLARESHV